MKSLNYLLLLMFVVPSGNLLAQNAFYVDLLQKGKLAFDSGQLQQADTYLEIAAFGLLDYRSLYLDASVTRMFVLAESGELDAANYLSLTLRTSLDADTLKPESMNAAFWDALLLLVGRLEAPSNAMFSDPRAVEVYLLMQPDSPDVWLGQLKRLQDPDEAGNWIAQGLSVLGQNLGFLESALIWFHDAGLDDRADDMANRLLAIDPNHSLAHELKAHLALRAGKNSQFNRHSQRITESRLQVSQERAVTRTEQETDATAEQDDRPAPEVSVRSLERRVKAEPANRDVRLQLVARYLDDNALRKARKQLSQLAKTDRSDAAYVSLFARFNYLSDNHESNLNLFDLDQRPMETDYYLARSCMALGLNDRALVLLKGISEQRFPDVVQMRNDALGASSTNKTVDRRATLERLVASQRATFIEQIQLGDIYLESNDWGDGRKYIQQLAKDFPREPQTQYLAARVMLNDGKFADAAKIFSGLANAGFTEKEVFYYGGMAYYSMGKRDLASYMFSRALKQGTRFHEQVSELQRELQ